MKFKVRPVDKALTARYVEKIAMSNCQHLPLSNFHFLERNGPSRPALDNLSAAVQSQLTHLKLTAERLHGRRISIAVGSRGIAGLQEIVRAVCGWLKSQGAHPFIIPAMGSHGGGRPRVSARYSPTMELPKQVWGQKSAHRLKHSRWERRPRAFPFSPTAWHGSPMELWWSIASNPIRIWPVALKAGC